MSDVRMEARRDGGYDVCPTCGRKEGESDPNAQDIDAIVQEHQEMCSLLMQSVDVMRTTQRLFELRDGHILMSKCREIERWLDGHQPHDETEQK